MYLHAHVDCPQPEHWAAEAALSDRPVAKLKKSRPSFYIHVCVSVCVSVSLWYGPAAGVLLLIIYLFI